MATILPLTTSSWVDPLMSPSKRPCVESYLSMYCMHAHRGRHQMMTHDAEQQPCLTATDKTT